MLLGNLIEELYTKQDLETKCGALEKSVVESDLSVVSTYTDHGYIRACIV